MTLEDHFKSVDWNVVKKKQEEMGKASTRIISSFTMILALFMVDNFAIPLILSFEAEFTSLSGIGFLVQIMPFMWYFPVIMVGHSIYSYLRWPSINVMRSSEKTEEEGQI